MDSPWNTLEDFLEASRKAKAEGKKLEIGIAGEAGLWHQAVWLWKKQQEQREHINIYHLQGQLINWLQCSVNTWIYDNNDDCFRPHLKEGTLRMLADE